MDSQAIIVAVSLYGSSTDQQPDPIVLRHEDESWRHFSTLMLSLYKSPPSAVNIKYLDDEQDWIDMGSEAEFSEALRMTRTSGEILQVRVLPVSADGWEDHNYVRDSPSTSLAPGQDPYKWIPTTDIRYQNEEQLQYPHPPPSASVCSYQTVPAVFTSVSGTQYIEPPATAQPWLFYPIHTLEPQQQTQLLTQLQPLLNYPGQTTEVQSEASNFAIPNPGSHSHIPQSNSCSEETVLQAGPSRPTVATRLEAPAAGDKTTLLAAASAWQDAAKLSAEEKVKFLKRLMSTGQEKDFAAAQGKLAEKSEGAKPATNNTDPCSEQYANVDSLLKEFAEETNSSAQSRKSIWGENVQLTPQGQDPFEVDTKNVMDHTQLLSEMDNSPTLTPTRISTALNDDGTDSSRQREAEPSPAFKFAGLSPLTFGQISSASQNSTTIPMAYEASQPSSALQVETPSKALPPNPKRSSKEVGKTKTLKEIACASDSKSAKTTVKPPVPLPRAMLMMEGAPCGANAVAIEMPAESEAGKAGLGGEEIAASGGAACVAASEETGEVLARDGDAAAVSSQIKQAEEGECGAGAVVSWETAPVVQMEVHSEKHRKEKSPEKKKSKEKDGKSEKKSHRKKSESSDKKSKDDKDKDKDKKKEEKKRKEEKEKKKQSKEDSRMKLSEDVESGEKVRVKGDAALQYNDFVKHMKKLKKEIQTSIVRDVTQETYRIVQTGIFSLSQAEMTESHKEMYSEGMEHIGIYCDHCNSSITGIRYKCGNCLDFDLCERCEGLAGLHDPTHVFLKLRQPARNAGCGPGGAGEKYCLLRENIYEVEGVEAVVDPGTPVDLSVHASGEEQIESSFETVEEEKPVVAEAAINTQAEKEIASGPRDNNWQEYEDLFTRLCRAQEIQDSVGRDRQVYGHLGGCSETLNSSSFDLTMARGIDSGMSKIGQEAEERLVAHTGPLPSAPPRQRYRGQDKTPECNSSNYGCSSSGGSSIVCLPTPPDGTPNTTPAPTLYVCDMSQPAELPRPDWCVKDAALPLSVEPTPLNLTRNISTSSTVPTDHQSFPVAPIAESIPEATSSAPSLPQTVPMIPLMAQSVPKSSPALLSSDASQLQTVPMVPLRAASLPQSAPPAPSTVSSLPESFAMITPAPPSPAVPQEVHTIPAIPLEAAAPAAVAAEELVVDGGIKDERLEAELDDEASRASRRGSGDSDDFVLENGSSSEDDEEYDDNERRADLHQMVWDSDSSDDFCIIDPENAGLVPEGFELLPDSTSLTAALTQSQTVTCDSEDLSSNSCPAPSYEEVMSASQKFCRKAKPVEVKVATTVEAWKAAVEEPVMLDVQEVTPCAPTNAEVTVEAPATVESTEPVLENEVVSTPALPEAEPVSSIPVVAASGSEVEQSVPFSGAVAAEGSTSSANVEEETKVVDVYTDVERGLIHKMSEEEKNRLLELLRMEMGREFILEERRAEAERRNRELELNGAQAERRQELAVQEQEMLHSSSTASLAGSASTRSRSLSRSTSEASSIGRPAAGEAREVEERISRSSSVASSSTRDADCQTVPTLSGQDQASTSHIIQNVATGVSKAATTAFLTAKDVFHALQAKQSEWKAPSSSYKPPQSQWKPPADTYRPPVSTYRPPENTYKPPVSTYKPPVNTYQPPRDYDDYSDYVPSSERDVPRSVFVEPNIEWVVVGNARETTPRNGQSQISETSAGSVSVAPIPVSEEAEQDSITSEQGVVGEAPSSPPAPDATSSSVEDGLESERRQRLGMQRLVEMGFANRQENQRLLTQCDGDLERVIQALVEGQQSWTHRH